MKRFLFNNVKSYKDFRKIVTDNIDYIYEKNYMPSQTFEKAISCMSDFPEQEEKYFIDFLKRVDDIYSLKNTTQTNAYHKFPIVLSGVLYYNCYPEVAAELTLDELVFLAAYSVIEPLAFYETALKTYGKSLLETIIKKTGNDKDDNISLLMISSSMIKNEDISKEQVTSYINKTSKDVLLEEYKKRAIVAHKKAHISM